LPSSHTVSFSYGKLAVGETDVSPSWDKFSTSTIFSLERWTLSHFMPPSDGTEGGGLGTVYGTPISSIEAKLTRFLADLLGEEVGIEGDGAAPNGTLTSENRKRNLRFSI
jgi:hypothetical protein